MSLTTNEKLVLEYYYRHPIGGFSVEEVFKRLNLDSKEERRVKKELSCQGLIRPIVSNKDGTYYEISEYGKRVHKNFETN